MRRKSTPTARLMADGMTFGNVFCTNGKPRFRTNRAWKPRHKFTLSEDWRPEYLGNGQWSKAPTQAESRVKHPPQQTVVNPPRTNQQLRDEIAKLRAILESAK